MDAPAIVEWLYACFPDFYSEPQFQGEFPGILDLLQFESAHSAFIGWCYSLILTDIPGTTIFQPWLPEFRLDRIELLFYLPSSEIIWLLDHLNPQKNQGQVHNLLCGWFQAQTGEDRGILFDYAVSKRLFRFDLLLGGQLDVLLPLANAYQDPTVFDVIVSKIKSSISKWRQAINSKASPELWQLSWDRIVQAFDLRSYPRPPGHPSTLVNEMRLAHRHLDSRFYHWMVANRRNMTVDILLWYLDIPSTDPNHTKKPYRRVTVIDFFNILGDQAHDIKVRIIRDFEATANFLEIFSSLSRKSNLVFEMTSFSDIPLEVLSSFSCCLLATFTLVKTNQLVGNLSNSHQF
jgi:hypothetical protein